MTPGALQPAVTESALDWVSHRVFISSAVSETPDHNTQTLSLWPHFLYFINIPQVIWWLWEDFPMWQLVKPLIPFFHGPTENLWLCSSLMRLFKKITSASTCFPCLFSGNRNLLLRRVSSTELRSKESERCSRRGNIQYIVSSREKVGHREKKRRRRRKNKKCGWRLMQANSPET